LKKINVAVVMGGPSVEREVSLNSGRQVLANLNPDKYDAFPVEITKDGGWLIGTDRIPLASPLKNTLTLTERTAKNGDIVLNNRQELDPAKIREAHRLINGAHIAYLALHGAMGEDGSIQGLFESLNFPYTGSGVLASALAMDKIRAKQIFLQAGLRTPHSMVYRDHEFEKNYKSVSEEIKSWIGIPCIVKPPELGSSVGVTLCRNEEELGEAMKKCFYYGPTALVEEYVTGVEVTCGVLDRTGGLPPIALPVTEISYPKEEFFDYKIKYTKGAAQEITPARITKEMTELVQKTALAVHRAIGCSGMSRTDMIIKEETPFVLETNTLPGMTQTSLLPQGAAAAGITFPELLDRIISVSLERHEVKNKYMERI